MEKRHLIFLATVVAGAAAFLALSAAVSIRPAFAVEIRIPSMQATAGQSIKVPVVIDQIDNLAGMKLVVRYDKAAMTYRSTEKAPQANTLIHIVNDKRPGTLIVVMAGARGIKGENLEILTFTFDVGAEVPAGSALPVNIVESQLMSDQLKEVEHRTTNGVIEIVGPKTPAQSGDRK
jgi:hypothetical protein